MIHNFYDEIRSALTELRGVKSVTRGWPKSFASKTLPCIAVEKASETPADFRDDDEHLTEIEYYIRLFADKAEQIDTIAPEVDAKMRKLGYQRTLTYDAGESDVRICHMRYRKYV